MNRTTKGSKLVQYGVPAFICLYLLLAFYPKYISKSTEIIPFSLFNLYTFIPYDYSNYDLLITEDNGKSTYLFYQNENLSTIERKYYYSWLRTLGEKLSINPDALIDSSHFIVQNIDGQVDLVRLSGDYQKTLINGPEKVEILKRIK